MDCLPRHVHAPRQSVRGAGVTKTATSCQDYHWIEVFAGRARATLAMKSAGLTTAKMDLLYHKGPAESNNYFDILSPAGFATGPQFRQFLPM